ncbi:MAG: aminoacyl-tRNA hydrolase [bacterium]|nr:aminoacyl-tRNA hydrolase [bacterium]
MIIVVGLGNPGKAYEHTRHNAGFLALDVFAKEHGYPVLKLSAKHQALLSEGTGAILAKPQTFMNKSGTSAKSLLKQGGELIVVHDDIDIPIGAVKVSKDRGSAGHKGVESIIEALGSKDFTRIRIGILPSAGKPEDVEDFVLKNFTVKELSLIQEAYKQASRILSGLIAETK